MSFLSHDQGCYALVMDCSVQPQTMLCFVAQFMTGSPVVTGVLWRTVLMLTISGLPLSMGCLFLPFPQTREESRPRSKVNVHWGHQNKDLSRIERFTGVLEGHNLSVIIDI